MHRYKKIVVLIGLIATLVLGGGSFASAQGVGGALGGLGLGGATPAPTTCSLEGVGWIVCPVLRSAAKAADYAFTFISQSFLGLELTLFDAGSGVQQAWRVMWNIANVGFVLALLWVVYAHITGHAAGTYNVKRMLPRLIIGAILVQVSFYISQLLVDVSNIIGAAVNNILAGIAASIGPSGMPLSTQIGSYDSVTLAGITGGVLGNNHVAWVLLAPLSAIVLLSAIICATLIVVLIVRKTLVMALVLLSPLAFVAYLLPSTEHLFSRWLKLLLQTLLLFPVVALLLGTGQIVSASILKAGAGASGYQVQHDEYVHPNESSNSSATLRLVAAGAAVLPLAGTWYAFRAAMSGTNAAVARIKRGSQRGMSRRRDDAAKRERVAMEMTNKTMMQKGVTRLQQLSSLQDARGGEGLLGGVFGNRRTRKKTPKSPEQTQFDNKVQDRLSTMRSEVGTQTPPLSPQALYSRALQQFNDAQSELGADEELSLVSKESIELKAAEALLLESIAKPEFRAGVGAKDAQNNASTTLPTENEPKHEPNTPAAAPSGPRGLSSPAVSDARTTGEPSAMLSSGVSTTGVVQTIVVDGQSPGLAGVGLSGATSSLKRDRPSEMEAQAKARAAKYVSQSADSLLQDDPLFSDERVSSQASDAPTETMKKISEMTRRQPTASPKATTDLNQMPSMLRSAEITARTSKGTRDGSGLDIQHAEEVDASSEKQER